ncbi:MAG: hypothetical protein QOJ81_415, partial [Chloroflexota bacterium]|nr:hypothetical protein [Chloroflexota bacterium]
AVAAAMGSVTTVIGTLVGSYFGYQVGNQGREKATDAATAASRTAVTAAAFIGRDDAPEFLNRVRQANADSTLNGNPDASDL